MGLTQTVAPTIEPLTISEVKAQCEYEEDDRGVMFERLIRTARKHYEETSGVQCINATWKWQLDDFPGSGEALVVPRNPLSSVTSIQYIDTAGDTQTWSSDDYDVDTDSLEGRIVPAYGETWPTTRSDINAVTVTFVAGYGTERQSVPDDIRSLLLLHVAQLFEYREPTVTGSHSRTVAYTMDALFWGSRKTVV